MVNCTVSEAAENGTAFIPSFRANDMRPESGVGNKLHLASIKPDQTVTLSPPFYLSLIKTYVHLLFVLHPLYDAISFIQNRTDNTQKKYKIKSPRDQIPYIDFLWISALLSGDHLQANMLVWRNKGGLTLTEQWFHSPHLCNFIMQCLFDKCCSCRM